MSDPSIGSEPSAQVRDRPAAALGESAPVGVPPKVVVSISLGTSKRNHRAETTCFGTPVILERIGADGDQKKARRLFEELDGRVDAFGFGGADLGLTVNGRYYPLHSVQALVAGLKTPVVDGGALRQVIERRCVQRAGPLLADASPKRALITTATDRYDLALSFRDAGYDLLIGDFGFALGLPVALHSIRALNSAVRLLLPVLSRMPLESLYPTGAKQEAIHVRFRRWFEWATVIGGDFLFLRTHLPDRLDGKIIVTNTTVADDVELLRSRGVRALVTSTPRLHGRSFGTNVMEAMLTAVAGLGRPLSPSEITEMIGEDGFPPAVEVLNP